MQSLPASVDNIISIGGKTNPLLSNPEDFAHGVLYLASDEAPFVTGTELDIDGGWTAL